MQATARPARRPESAECRIAIPGSHDQAPARIGVAPAVEDAEPAVTLEGLDRPRAVPDAQARSFGEVSAVPGRTPHRRLISVNKVYLEPRPRDQPAVGLALAPLRARRPSLCS